MTINELEVLKDRIKKANILLGRIKKCQDNVKHFTHIEGAAQYASNRHEWAKGKLDYWIKALDNAKLDFKNL